MFAVRSMLWILSTLLSCLRCGQHRMEILATCKWQPFRAEFSLPNKRSYLRLFHWLTMLRDASSLILLILFAPLSLTLQILAILCNNEFHDFWHVEEGYFLNDLKFEAINGCFALLHYCCLFFESVGVEEWIGSICLYTPLKSFNARRRAGIDSTHDFYCRILRQTILKQRSNICSFELRMWHEM